MVKPCDQTRYPKFAVVPAMDESASVMQTEQTPSGTPARYAVQQDEVNLVQNPLQTPKRRASDATDSPICPGAPARRRRNPLIESGSTDEDQELQRDSSQADLMCSPQITESPLININGSTKDNDQISHDFDSSIISTDQGDLPTLYGSSMQGYDHELVPRSAAMMSAYQHGTNWSSANNFVPGYTDTFTANTHQNLHHRKHTHEYNIINGTQPTEDMRFDQSGLLHDDIQMTDFKASDPVTSFEQRLNMTAEGFPAKNPPAAQITNDLMQPSTQVVSDQDTFELASKPPLTSADDSILLADQRRGRLLEYIGKDSRWHPKKRNASVPLRCGSHYSYIANWPPQDPPTCDFGTRIDVFPPKDAPLHVHLQAYALRWGVWTAEIKDKKVRQQILGTVADKMKESWENAIGENYYVRPVVPNEDSDHQNDAEEKEERTKRGRKRQVSPSRQAAGFLCEGKDRYAVTNAELAQNNLTMDMIIKRVQERNFDAGEERLDQVLTDLDRDQLTEKDWSAGGYAPVVRGRNLLMYALWVVLECRRERKKLSNLLPRFAKEIQKRNTRTRIEQYQEREFQHMALATELNLARLEEASGSSTSEHANDETDAVGSEIENRRDESVLDDEMDVDEAPAAVNDPIGTDHSAVRETAQAVLNAISETDLYAIFSERRLNSTSFDVEDGLQAEIHGDTQKAKGILCEIYEAAADSIALKEMSKRQENPRDLLKMRHDARLCFQRIIQSREKLAKIVGIDLKSMSEPEIVQQPAFVNTPSPTPQTSAEAADKLHMSSVDPSSSHRSGASTQASNFIAPPNIPDVSGVEMSDDPEQLAVANMQPSSTHGASVATSSAQASHQQTQPSPVKTPQDQQVSPSTSRAAQVKPLFEDDDKLAYIQQVWRPWLDNEYAKRGRPAHQGELSSWQHLRDLMQELGFSTDRRNHVLGAFKEQYKAWSESRGIASQARSESVQPSVRPMSQHRNQQMSTQVSQQPIQHPMQHAVQQVTQQSMQQPTQQVSYQQNQYSQPVPQSPAFSISSTSPVAPRAPTNLPPPNWPQTHEVIARIPPQGIHIGHLVQMFQDRIGPYMQQFGQLITHIAYVDHQTKTIYPPSHQAVEARQYMYAPQSPFPSPRQTPQTVRPQQIIKLKMPQESIANLPRVQDETNFNELYKSAEVNATKGFSFRHLPHSTLEQRMAIDEFIGEYVKRTSRSKKKDHHGEYITFNDPETQQGPPIAHGFWDHKDGTKPEGTEWFYNGEEVPVRWLPHLDLNTNETPAAAQNANGGQQHVVNHNQIKLRLNVPNHAQATHHHQIHAHLQPGYNTYPPGYGPTPTSTTNTPKPQVTSDQYPIHRNLHPQNQTSVRGYLDGNTSDTDYQAQSTNATTTKMRGTKRGASAINGAEMGEGNGRGGKARLGKGRKKVTFVDVGDSSDGDWVPGGED